MLHMMNVHFLKVPGDGFNELKRVAHACMELKNCVYGTLLYISVIVNTTG